MMRVLMVTRERTWRHLVAVRNADHGIGLMSIHHIFNRVCDNVARGQRIEHTIMSHRDTIVNGNGIELSGIAAHLFNLFTDNLSYLVQMGMTRYKLGK